MQSLRNEAGVKEGAGPGRRFVAYYRVSTGRQGSSGLGLDGQHALVREFLAANEGCLLGEFSETISGRKDNRPQLNSALALCRVARATLIIARLDLVRDGETGLLVPSGDADALAEAMLALAAEPARAAEMGRQGRVRALERFPEARCSERTEEVYRY